MLTVGADRRVVVMSRHFDASRPEHVKVSDARQNDDDRNRDGGTSPRADGGLALWKADGDESIERERDKDPDGDVAARVVDELLRATRPQVQFVEADDAARPQPIRKESGDEDEHGADGHRTEVDSGRCFSERSAAAGGDQHRQNVSDDPKNEDRGRSVHPNVAVGGCL